MNKKGGLTDLFLFMILAFAIVFISGVMIYVGNTTYTELRKTFEGKTYGGAVGNLNATVNLENTMGVLNNTYKSLYWLSVFIIFGMILGIFIGSYMVTTRPIFFVPYFFITLIAIVVSVFISNTYETILSDATIGSTFEGFVGANYIMGYLPIWITIIGFVGAMIMFSRLGSKENEIYGGMYG